MQRKDTRTDAPLCAPMGLLSGLEAQGEISELLDELYGDGPGLSRLGNVPIPEQPPELTDRRPASTVPAVLAPGKLMSHWYVRKPRGTKFDDVSPFVRLLGQFIITNGMYQ